MWDPTNKLVDRKKKQKQKLKIITTIENFENIHLRIPINRWVWFGEATQSFNHCGEEFFIALSMVEFKIYHLYSYSGATMFSLHATNSPLFIIININHNIYYINAIIFYVFVQPLCYLFNQLVIQIHSSNQLPFQPKIRSNIIAF